MKRILLLLANGFEIYEASVFVDVIGWNKTYGTKDTELFTCGLTKNLTSTFGVKVEVDYTINSINPQNFEALAIPGEFENYGFYEDAYSKEFQELIKTFYKSNNIISSICAGALSLGKSGILKDKRATTYNQMDGKRQKQLEKFGVKIINEPIVKDENITTSWSPVTAIDVAFNLLEDLTNETNVNYIKEIMGFSGF